MNTTGTAAVFAEIVAEFDKKIPCTWWRTVTGRPCGRGARWSVDAHGCFGGLLCGNHFWEWFRENEGATECGTCGTEFPCFEAAVTVRKL